MYDSLRMVTWNKDDKNTRTQGRWCDGIKKI